MPKRYFGTSIRFTVFKKQLLQGASTDLINPLISKAHNCECQDLLNFFYGLSQLILGCRFLYILHPRQ